MNAPDDERLALKEQFLLLLRFLSGPAQALDTMCRKAPVTAAFVVLTGLGLTVQWALIPYIAQAAQHALEASVGPADLEHSLTMMRRIQLLALLFYPFSLTAKWVLLGLILALLCQLLGGPATVRQGLSVCVHASFLPLLQTAQVYLILLLNGIDSVRDASDLQPPIGLDLLWTASHPLTAALLHHVNPFEVAYLAFLLAAVGRVNPAFSNLRRVAAALPFWLLTVGVRVLLTTAGQSGAESGAG